MEFVLRLISDVDSVVRKDSEVDSLVRQVAYSK
jgi:hypothetical protein